MIERQLSNIEKNFREKKIQLAFNLISNLKTKYPKNKRYSGKENKRLLIWSLIYFEEYLDKFM